MKRGPKPFDFKVCPVCGIEKPRSEYYKKLNTVSHKCKQCTLTDCKTRAPKYYSRYKDYRNSWRREKYSEDPEYRKRHAAAAKSIYRAIKKATPPWVDRKEIAKIYRERPIGMEVDHIIPIRGFIDGRQVSGLHVPWNLQYLTATENGRKRNLVSEKDIILTGPVIGQR